MRSAVSQLRGNIVLCRRTRGTWTAAINSEAICRLANLGAVRPADKHRIDVRALDCNAKAGAMNCHE